MRIGRNSPNSREKTESLAQEARLKPLGHWGSNAVTFFFTFPLTQLIVFLLRVDAGVGVAGEALFITFIVKVGEDKCIPEAESTY